MNCFGFTEVEPKPKSTKRLLREKLAGDEDGKGINIYIYIYIFLKRICVNINMLKINLS